MSFSAHLAHKLIFLSMSLVPSPQQNIRQALAGLLVGFSEDMTVDVQRRADVRVTQPFWYGDNIGPAVNQEAGRAVPI